MFASGEKQSLRKKYDVVVAGGGASGLIAAKAAAQNGWVDERSTVLEMLMGMKRAGADLIITYHAKDAIRWLKEQ